MSHTTKCSFVLVPLLLIAVPASAQYYGERVQEKTFEATDFFFRPSYLNPYGLSGFGAVMPGLLDDPLLNLHLNPATLASDTLTDGYAYLDFRNRRLKQQHSHYYPRYLYDHLGVSYRTSYIYYPQYYVDRQPAPDPVVSAAYLMRPFTRGPVFGATYQLIFSDDAYYRVPADIYRSQAGFDLTGERMAAEAAFNITDRARGSDTMRQRGHFASFFMALPIVGGLDLGVRMSGVLFDRTGTYEHLNRWTHHSNASFYDHLEDRDQDYTHWDASAGLTYRAPGFQLGAAIGYLEGEATQDLGVRDTSQSGYGTTGGSDWSHYHQAHREAQAWEHTGHTRYGSVHLTANLSPTRVLTLHYTLRHEDVDLSSRSTIRDSSYSSYYHDYDADSYFSISESHYRLSDDRSGSGSRDSWAHRAAATLRWHIGDHMRLHTGAHLSITRRTTETEETVLASYNNASMHEYQREDMPEPTRSDSQRGLWEDKQLEWDFEVQTTSFRIPVLLSFQAASALELMVGVNRHLQSWTITDVTLARIYERTESKDGVETRETNVGERYTEPREVRSHVQTTILVGATVTPAERFDVRVLIVPNFSKQYSGNTLREVQWWIAFTARP